MKKQKLIKAWMIAKRSNHYEIWSPPFQSAEEAMRHLVKYQSTFEVVEVEIRILK